MVFISFNGFLHGFNGFSWFEWLFEPIRFEIHQVSAQMVDSRPEAWHFLDIGPWATGDGGPLAKSSRCGQGLCLLEKNNKPPDGSNVKHNDSVDRRN